MNTPKTKNFSVKTDPKLQCTCGLPQCPKPVVTQFMLDRLQAIRNDLGSPMNITSGARCKFHPSEAHRDKAGDHQLLDTVDVEYTDELHKNKLMVLAGRHGATRVAHGKVRGVGFVHMAWTLTERKDVPTWEYK